MYCTKKCNKRAHDRRRAEYRQSLAIEMDMDPIPPQKVLAERQYAQERWQNVFGDPLPGRSALDRRVSQ